MHNCLSPGYYTFSSLHQVDERYLEEQVRYQYGHPAAAGQVANTSGLQTKVSSAFRSNLNHTLYLTYVFKWYQPICLESFIKWAFDVYIELFLLNNLLCWKSSHQRSLNAPFHNLQSVSLETRDVLLVKCALKSKIARLARQYSLLHSMKS